MPSSNSLSTFGETEGGFSFVPAATPDPNIVLTRLGDESASINAPEMSTAYSGIDSSTILGGSTIPAVSAGNAPVSLGTIPAIAGIPIPDPSLLEVDMKTVDNSFDPVIEDPTRLSAPSSAPSMKPDTGVVPKANGKPMN